MTRKFDYVRDYYAKAGSTWFYIVAGTFDQT